MGIILKENTQAKRKQSFPKSGQKVRSGAFRAGKQLFTEAVTKKILSKSKEEILCLTMLKQRKDLLRFLLHLLSSACQ